jgi:hypothetical protein
VLVQIERVPSQLWISAVETLATSRELDEQRDGTLGTSEDVPARCFK